MILDKEAHMASQWSGYEKFSILKDARSIVRIQFLESTCKEIHLQ